MQRDAHWRALIKHCADHGAYRGTPLPPLDSGEDGEADGSNQATAQLAADMEELLRPEPEQASAQMQQEGMEMPVHE